MDSKLVKDAKILATAYHLLFRHEVEVSNGMTNPVSAREYAERCALPPCKISVDIHMAIEKGDVDLVSEMVSTHSRAALEPFLTESRALHSN